MPNNTLGNRKEQALFLQTGDPTKERRVQSSYPWGGPTDTYAGGQMGQRFSVPDPTTGLAADWQIVLTDSVMDVLPWDGAVAWWIDRANYVVTTDVSRAGRGNIAGVFRDSDAPQDNTVHNIGLSTLVCIQKKGQVEIDYVDAPVSAPLATGLFVIPSATDGKADCLAAASPATYPPLGKSLSTVTNHYGTVDLDINDQP
jgi:hypothetical protein